MIAVSACGGMQPETAESTARLIPSPTSEPVAYFKVAVIVDMTSDPVSLEQVDELLAIAHAKLVEVTGFGLQRVGFVEDYTGGSVDEIATDYMTAHQGSLPNGIVIFSVGDDDQARINRAYARQIPAPSGFHNSFVSPYYGTDHMYLAILQFHYHYAACGYGDADTIQSASPIGGECRGEGGVACVRWNGLQVCETALEFLEGHTPTDMAAGPLIHEFMHPFGGGEADDHYGTQACNEAMGWPADHFDFDESEHYNATCPFVYDVFIDSYQP